ncbi:MAG: AAA family ATPase [Proteobacteria bacterium]|nr:AAA family ATPase [Pseudomonadota bacterium]
MLLPTPWANIMRPSLNTIAQLTGPARRLWDNDLKRLLLGHMNHVVFWGPPGCGKTTLALLICEARKDYGFRQLSAVSHGIPEIKKAIDQLGSGGTLFIDEIHRLTRPQQDVLLPVLESGACWLIAATTENPAATLSPALLSRVRTQRVHPPSPAEVSDVLLKSLSRLETEAHTAIDDERKKRITDQWIPVLAKRSEGDVRLALNLLEGLAFCSDPAAEHDLIAGQLRAWTEKTHYDYASAMIKSMRGSDPDAALFYAIAALESGEDPKFLLRRCVIFASEDIGNADPSALRIAVDCFDAFEKTGMPEGRYAIAQAVCYLSSTVKSNRLLKALGTVSEWWKNAAESNARAAAPPEHLTLKGHEKYRYPHNFPNSFVREKYLPESIEQLRQKSGAAYLPSDEGIEAKLKDRLRSLWSR